MKPRRYRRCVAVVALVLMLSFAVGAWVVGGSLVAAANRPVGPPPADLPVETLRIASSSGSELAAWLVPADGATATVVLLHPIRGDRRSMLGRAALLHEAGFAVLMIDFQAHGESAGERLTLGHLEKLDVRAAVAFVRLRSPGHQIGVVGRSLGGASALLASPLGVDAMVVESVYPTVADAVYDRVGMRLGVGRYAVAPALLCQLGPRLGVTPADLRPIDFVDDAGCPILIAAGDRDLHTPIDETRRLFEAARDPKQLVVFRGAGHVDLLEYDPQAYRDEILPFLQAKLIK
ncbi:Alpha/beta hydrolase family protein [Pirellulimonas nuda]|uniref:Alpha/beta hydrolase family protein n=1 Tax=Pirellulimonas nuda TaxID=2528009 RepID=A0A518DED0_9BACT|nr:alpha/beta hydrolase [Pirellulimonas nuda]QDU89823.1 Alpha/beta hydrolase family protein [Pirellulimonas nuda]